MGNHHRQGGFPQSRRSVQQNMVQGFLTCLGGLNVDAQLMLDLFLANVVLQALGTERQFNLLLCVVLRVIGH